jgi:UDP-N-acetylmuramoylalanine--D-glutamate ligase
VHALACDVAVLLNLEPDHLDRHGTFDAYRDAKLRIFERARVKIVPRGMGLDGIEFAADDPLPAEPRIPGLHNRENAAAATAAARAFGIGDDAIVEALTTFAGVPHRLELVREMRGVRYVNDSKATNTAAARRGVAAYDVPLRLILGGSLKGEDFAPFARDLPANVRSIYLIGEATDELAAALDRAGKTYSREGDLEHALAHATADAEPGDIVLLSPAVASFDQFPNFEARGDAFRRLVEALP